MFQSLFGILLNHLYHYASENVSVKHLSLICITSTLTTIYSLKNCSVYGRSCRIYSPISLSLKKKVIYRLRVGPYGEKLWRWRLRPNIDRTQDSCLQPIRMVHFFPYIFFWGGEPYSSPNRISASHFLKLTLILSLGHRELEFFSSFFLWHSFTMACTNTFPTSNAFVMLIKVEGRWEIQLRGSFENELLSCHFIQPRDYSKCNLTSTCRVRRGKGSKL